MTQRIIATAIALLFALSMPRVVAAKGHGGGHSGGGHASGGHSGGGHSAGGHASSGRSSGGQSKGGSVHGGGVRAGGGTAPASPRGASPGAPVGTTQPRGSSHPPDGHAVVGTAVPRTSGPRDVFVVTPSIYTPHFFRPRVIGLGFGFGIRHLGYGFGPAYYGLGYDHPLLCETAIDCDFIPMTGAVDMPPYAPYTPYTPYETAPPDVGSGSVRLEVQPVIAQIFVDGEYVGTVEDFRSGSGLVIEAGVHRVEFRAPGYAPLVVDMRIAPGRRITYRGALKPPSP